MTGREGGADLAPPPGESPVIVLVRPQMAENIGAGSLDETVGRESRDGKRLVVMARSDYRTSLCAVRQMPAAPADYARALYATLHQLDREGVEVIIVEPVPDDDAWAGVRYRLTRARA